MKSIKANAPAAVSEVRSFNGTKFKILSPSDAEEDVPMAPEISWTPIGEGATYTLEISSKSDYSTIAYTTNVQATSVTVPSGCLATATTYYARVRTLLGGIQVISEKMSFITEEKFVPVPTIISPADNVSLPGNEIEISWQRQDSKGFRAELSQSSTFPTRGTTVIAVEAFTYSAVFDGLSAGTYYLRVRAVDKEGQTDPSEFITVYLTGTSAIQAINTSDFCYSYCDAAGNCYVVMNVEEQSSASIAVYSITGVLLDKQIHGLDAGRNILSLNMIHYAKGFYLVKVNTGSIEKTIKVKK